MHAQLSVTSPRKILPAPSAHVLPSAPHETTSTRRRSPRFRHRRVERRETQKSLGRTKELEIKTATHNNGSAHSKAGHYQPARLMYITVASSCTAPLKKTSADIFSQVAWGHSAPANPSRGTRHRGDFHAHMSTRPNIWLLRLCQLTKDRRSKSNA